MYNSDKGYMGQSAPISYVRYQFTPVYLCLELLMTSS